MKRRKRYQCDSHRDFVRACKRMRIKKKPLIAVLETKRLLHYAQYCDDLPLRVVEKLLRMAKSGNWLHDWECWVAAELDRHYHPKEIRGGQREVTNKK